jgi:hypothetical protein
LGWPGSPGCHGWLGLTILGWKLRHRIKKNTLGLVNQNKKKLPFNLLVVVL